MLRGVANREAARSSAASSRNFVICAPPHPVSSTLLSSIHLVCQSKRSELPLVRSISSLSSTRKVDSRLSPSAFQVSSAPNSSSPVQKRFAAALGVGGITCTILGVFGVWNVVVFSFKTILGLGVIGIGVALFLFYRKRKNVVVYEPLIRELNKHRKKLEEYIGPYELPHSSQVLSWKKTSKGRNLNMIVYQFQIDGARGTGFGAMRAVEAPVVQSDGSKVLKWQIEKLRVELQSVKHAGQGVRYDIVDKDLSSVKYIDNVRFEEL